MDKNSKYIIGIDEVGRGPIAGPVAVCAFCMSELDQEEIVLNAKEQLGLPIRDSKKLTKIQREKWYKYLNELKKEGKCNFHVSYVSPENIDKFGINKCIQKALDKSLAVVADPDCKNFLRRCGRAGASDSERRGISEENYYNPEELYIYLDGGLKAPKEYVNQETVIKGDELHPVISFASIVAKVSRDKIMTKYSKEFSNYGFENHSGYGTRAHYEAIKKHGITPLHRKSFIKK